MLEEGRTARRPTSGPSVGPHDYYLCVSRHIGQSGELREV